MIRLGEGVNGQIQQPNSDLMDFFSGLVEMAARFKAWLEANSDAITEAVSLAHRHVLFNSANWLPHYTTPFHLVDFQTDAAGLVAMLERYYAENWDQVRAAFEARLLGLPIDDEAKATFREALDAHGMGLYRVAPRLLFPEIERIVREEYFGGKLGIYTSLKEARTAVGQLGFSELQQEDGDPVFAQFRRFYSHLYENVGTAERVAELSLDAVPNRHAALHGLVTYKSLQTSLNALIMAEFMFHAVPTGERQRATQGALQQES